MEPTEGMGEMEGQEVMEGQGVTAVSVVAVQ